MPVLSIKHLLLVLTSILLIFVLLIMIWRTPPAGMALSWIFLLFCLVATSYSIVKKHRKPDQQRKIPLFVSIRDISLEIAAILLAMILAGMIGRFVSGAAFGEVNNTLDKFIAQIGIGILVGWVVGIVIKSTSSRLMKSLSGR